MLFPLKPRPNKLVVLQCALPKVKCSTIINFRYNKGMLYSTVKNHSILFFITAGFPLHLWDIQSYALIYHKISYMWRNSD